MRRYLTGLLGGLVVTALVGCSPKPTTTPADVNNPPPKPKAGGAPPPPAPPSK
jgi:hypothetical protein